MIWSPTGGATAIQSPKTDKRIKTCFVLDGWINPVPKATIERGMQKPLLCMGRPSWEGSDYPDNYNILNQFFSNSSAPSYNIIIKNTLHLDYTDIPLQSPIGLSKRCDSKKVKIKCFEKKK